MGFTLVVLLLSSACAALRIQTQEQGRLKNQNRSITWEVTMNCSNPDGLNDYVIFGEAPDANDGPPHDVYDTPKPPAPFPPYIRAWFTDGLPTPYDSLLEDFRFYPDTTKVWNLTLHWMPSSGSSPTSITVTWIPSQVDNSEYSEVNFCSDTGVVLENMLVSNSYTFSCPAYVPQNFKILCSGNANHPPVANPDSYNTSVDSTLIISAPGVLGNDMDIDGDPLTATKQTDPSHGALTLNGNGGFTYLPSQGYQGTDSFTYKAYDGTAYSNVGTVTLNVQTNVPPLKPQRPTGPSSGKIRIEYTYNATTTDPNNNQLFYQWSWGDGTTSDWIGPFASGQISQAKHTWTTKGNFQIKVKAKDTFGAESNWSDPMSVTMPFSQSFPMNHFEVFFHILFSFLRGEYAGMDFVQILRMEGWLT